MTGFQFLAIQGFISLYIIVVGILFVPRKGERYPTGKYF
jgi:hypothetical protein